ncbi:sensor domain-containing diguanylate cyclase [Ectothiorhodospiraceae bacterium BW-2]|nr:sensor domain-containing diguanylate cyclase [Ectothiorhodospiraceae bacterium BW-2]
MAAISVRHSLVSYTLWRILGIVSFVGLITSVAGYLFTADRAEREAVESINALINVIEPTANIACYLNDTGAATEIVNGLLSSRLIAKVALYGSTQSPLASDTKPSARQQQDSRSMSRLLYSPFEAQQSVGKIIIELDQSELQRTVQTSLLYVVIPVIGQTLIGIVALLLLLQSVISPKIRGLIEQLNRVKCDYGETLCCQPEDEKNEIGALINYINRLINSMFQSLESERELRQQHEIQRRQYHSILENTSTCIFTFTPEGTLLSANRACKECIVDSDIDSQDSKMHFIERLVGFDTEIRKLFESAIDKQQQVDFDIQVKASQDQTVRWLKVNLTPIGNGVMQGVLNDITELKMEAQLAQSHARIDPLTQVANRLGFNERLEWMLASVHRGECSMTVMMIDLDHFKQVNDTLGHAAGDDVLKSVTRRIADTVRESDFIARLGGDEFVILLSEATKAVAERIAVELLQKIGTKILCAAGQSAQVGASIGIYLIPRGTDIEAKALLERADERMYEIKKSGRNSYGFVDE